MCLLSSIIRIQQLSRDLGVVITTRLSLSEHVDSVCRSDYYQVCQLRQAPDARQWMPPGRWSCHHCQSRGLVQLTVLRHHLRVDATSSVSAECCGQAPDGVTTSHLCFASCTGFLCGSYKIVTLVHRCLSGHVPSCLADDCRLVTDTGVRWLRSANIRTLVVGRIHGIARTFTVTANRQPDFPYGQFRRSLNAFLFG